MSPIIKLSTKKSAPDAFASPQVEKMTNYEIVIQTDGILEFFIDNGLTWQDSSAFTNLKSNTEYIILARIAETVDCDASAPSEIIVKTRSFLENLWHKIFG